MSDVNHDDTPIPTLCELPHPTIEGVTCHKPANHDGRKHSGYIYGIPGRKAPQGVLWE